MTSHVDVNTVAFQDDDNWRWRWMYLREGKSAKLHRIVSYQHKEDYNYVGVDGAVAACGLESDFAMPGIMSRMEGARCRECAIAMGVKITGRGSPFNRGEKENWELKE